jgi:hypothetical protein
MIMISGKKSNEKITMREVNEGWSGWEEDS